MEATDVRSVVAVGFCCADVYQDLGRFYPTGNGVDWGVHLARMGVPVSVVSVVGGRRVRREDARGSSG
jgi:fructoselysine 6-kinase